MKQKQSEISQESLRNVTENFRIFSRNVSFTGNPKSRINNLYENSIITRTN